MLHREKKFWFGLTIRLILIVCCIPIIRANLFIPFVSSTLSDLSFNPWATFHAAHSIGISSFPYGPTMLFPIILTYLPMAILNYFFKFSGLINVSIAITVLLFDLALMMILQHLVEYKNKNKVLMFYWLSPIVIYINYWHGQLDIIPVTYLVFCLYFVRELKTRLAGVFLALAIAAKLSMLIAAPVIIIYYYRNNRVRHLANKFLLSVSVSSIVILFPFLASLAFDQMVLFNHQIYKTTDLSILYSGGLGLHILPIVFLLFLYYVWSTERINQKLLFSMIGVSFTIILALTPASVGWYMWMIPFLVIYLIESKLKSESYIYFIGSLIFVFMGMIFNENSYVIGSSLSLIHFFHKHIILFFSYSDWLTLLAVTLIIVSLRMYRRCVQQNPHYFLSRTPLSVGIAGDSGSGKDTLAGAICGLFAVNSATNISGDDYHKWDRYSPMWKSITHLNPMANNLHEYAADVAALIGGQSIITRSYSHVTGMFTRSFSVNKKDVVIASGLHVLSLSKIVNLLDVKIFLDMDESLRLYFKIRRDLKNRGHGLEKIFESIEMRKYESINYINKQIENADIVFSLKPLNSINLKEDIAKDAFMEDLTMEIILNNDSYYQEITSFLSASCQCHVTSEICPRGFVKIHVYSGVSSEDVKLGVKVLAPDVLELLSVEPVWQDGFLGIMQLVVLLQIFQKIKVRKFI